MKITIVTVVALLLIRDSEAFRLKWFDGILDLLNGVFCGIPWLNFLCTDKRNLTIDYLRGINLNFQITEEEAERLMPSDQFTPLKMNVLDGDDEEVYLLSWYVARITGEFFLGIETQNARADLFTYALDQNGVPGLVFVAAIMEVPSFVSVSLHKWRTGECQTLATLRPRYGNCARPAEDALVESGGAEAV